MKNVHYINAGAGAGKTYTLVTILKQILTDKTNPCSPSEIILTTYTKAAAKEFRKKTFQRLLEAPAALDVAKILDTATIGTVHSVAQQYIQRYWTLLGYSGQFNVMSNVDKKRYINQSLKNIATPDDLSAFYEYTQNFKITKYDSKRSVYFTNYDFWKDYVLEIVGKMRAYDIKSTDLKKFCKQSRDVVDRLFVNQDYNLITFNSKVSNYLNFLNTSLSDVNKKDGKPSQLAKSSEGKLKIYNIFISKTIITYNDLKNFCSSKFFEPSAKASTLEHNSAIDSLEYIQKCLLSIANGAKVKDCIKRIFTIAENWAKAFEDYKRQNNLLDFDDLEAKFLELLQYDEVKNDIKSSIKYLFVDEFQDSNPIQLEIFKQLSDLVQIKSFWVGDRKQAIYGFRGSDSALITNLLNTNFATLGSDEDRFDPGLTSELIDTSYRSIKSLVELSNAVFEKSFATGVPDEIINNVPLQVHRVQPGKDDGNITTPIQHWHCTSEDALANKVADILNDSVPEFQGVYDDNDNWQPQIKPSDIAILSRTGTDCDKVAEALRKKGIPVSSPETSILDKAEVKLVFALLKYVDGIKRRYAKTELAKLLEEEIVTEETEDGTFITKTVSKTIETILKEIAANRFDFNPFFDEESDETDSAGTASKAEKSTTSSKSKADKKDPDKLFAELNDKLQGLRGLNISAIVKGVIAVMDVRNIVAKWGNAIIRQDNLDTLIEQAIAFEQSTANTADSATVADFLRYMKEVKLESELDQSAEGVKVATYHKSKGLQWPIVILNSLDEDELEVKDFVKKNWFGLNLKGEYGSAELQLIPSCVEVSDAVAEAVTDLSTAGSGKDDNGYYDMKYGKTEGELKRLLYVGVTRARDYLVTLSFPKSKNKTTEELSWIKNVRKDGRSSMSDLMNLSKYTNPDIELWGDDQHLSKYEVVNSGTSIYTPTAAAPMKLKSGRSLDGTTEPKTLSPSKIGGKITATATLVPGTDFTSQEIKHGSITDAAEFGTCIHNYFAVHVWDGSGQVANHQANNIALAQATVANHGKEKELPQPELLTNAADKLFTFLEKTFGAGDLLRECPFTYCRDNGQLVSGEIDLVWKLDNGECILVDYKNFPATGGYGKTTVLDNKPDNAHYVGHYFPQLNEYKTALEAAGLTVKKVFIFYAVLGCLVEVEGN